MHSFSTNSSTYISWLELRPVGVDGAVLGKRCGEVLTRSRVFFARSLTKGWAIGGILAEADMMISVEELTRDNLGKVRRE